MRAKWEYFWPTQRMESSENARSGVAARAALRWKKGPNGNVAPTGNRSSRPLPRRPPDCTRGGSLQPRCSLFRARTAIACQQYCLTIGPGRLATQFGQQIDLVDFCVVAESTFFAKVQRASHRQGRHALQRHARGGIAVASPHHNLEKHSTITLQDLCLQ